MPPAPAPARRDPVAAPLGRGVSARGRASGPIAGLAALRGQVVGAMVAGLAVAAHGAGGGGVPGSAGVGLLLVAAAGIGALAGQVRSVAGPGGRLKLLGALAAGQLAGHEALSGLAHEHGSDSAATTFGGQALPGGAMIGAHALATLGCALLIVLAERLYALVAQAFRAAVERPGALVPARDAACLPTDPTPARGRAGSGALGSRGPPVRV
ncbi:hypothetical protein ACWDSJ_04165 [Nocardia sp. NPDC003482]